MSVSFADTIPTTRLLGLRFADLDLAAASRVIADRPDGSPFGYVVTPNADHLVRLSRNPALLPLYQNALLCLLDSRVVGRAARALGLRTPAIVPGSDLTERILRLHVRPQERVCIIGLRDRHLASLVARCGLAPPAHFDPPIGFDRNVETMRQAVDFVLANPTRLILLAVGSPRQEQLAAAIHASGVATGTALCIGASLEFIAGAVPRAPRLMQRAGLEWMHRLASDPARLWRRYLKDSPPIFVLLLRERRRRR